MRYPLNAFSGHLTAEAEVEGTCEGVYAIVSQPDFVARSTPFIRAVTAVDESRWLWHVADIRYPGGHYSASLTQRLTFHPPHRIDFCHDPEATGDLAGAEGSFTIDPVPGEPGGPERVRLAMRVRVDAQVPAPRRAAPVVEGAMAVVMRVMRDRFVERVSAELEGATT